MSTRQQQLPDGAPRSELFVRGIPLKATEDNLLSFFGNIAPVRHAVLVKDKETGESRGFGFVSFSSPDDAQTALNACKNLKLMNQKLNIDFAKPRSRQDGAKTDRELDISTNKERRRPRLIIRNVPWSLRNPEELKKIFSKYGKVMEAYIPRGANNRMSGFAFVTMRRKAHAKEAIDNSKDLEIHGRPVAVDFAVQREKWENGARETLDEQDSDSESGSEAESNDNKSTPDDKDDGSASEEEEEEEEESGPDPEFPELDLDASSDEFTDEENEKEEDDKPVKKTGPRPLNDEHTVFVRNVPYDATADSLRDHFSQFGVVAYALPVIDKKLNQPKGTAFVAFKNVDDCNSCVARAPEITSSSLLIPDDVDTRYVYEGRILSVTQAVQRERAEHLAEKRSNERLAALGKEPRSTDKRRLFLMNEGRIARDSKLAQLLSPTEMSIREKSFQLRRQQLQKNPSLHLSMTRLAIRNLPRAMSEKALKALGRKAIVEFAREVANKQRQQLSKEEIMRSVHYQDSLGESEKKSKKSGVVRQAKIVQEVKGSGSAGRSRGYGFLELKNHKSALMALRWLNAHLVTPDEIESGDGEKANFVEMPEKRRRLVVEFAIENAQVVKRQRERQLRARETSKKRKAAEMEAQEEQAARTKLEQEAKELEQRQNSFIGRKRKAKKLKRS